MEALETHQQQLNGTFKAEVAALNAWLSANEAEPPEIIFQRHLQHLTQWYTYALDSLETQNEIERTKLKLNSNLLSEVREGRLKDVDAAEKTGKLELVLQREEKRLKLKFDSDQAELKLNLEHDRAELKRKRAALKLQKDMAKLKLDSNIPDEERQEELLNSGSEEETDRLKLKFEREQEKLEREYDQDRAELKLTLKSEKEATRLEVKFENEQAELKQKLKLKWQEEEKELELKFESEQAEQMEAALKRRTGLVMAMLKLRLDITGEERSLGKLQYTGTEDLDKLKLMIGLKRKHESQQAELEREIAALDRKYEQKRAELELK